MIQITDVQKSYLDLFLKFSKQVRGTANICNLIAEAQNSTRENAYAFLYKLKKKGVLINTPKGWQVLNVQYEVLSVQDMLNPYKQKRRYKQNMEKKKEVYKPQKVRVISPIKKPEPVEIIEGKIVRCPMPVWS